MLRTAIITAFLSLSCANASELIGVSTKCLPAAIKAKLAHIDRHYGRVTVVSAYSRRKIAGTNKWSKHSKCLAADFTVSRNQRAALKWLYGQPVEVITYRRGFKHIHVAVGNWKGVK